MNVKISDIKLIIFFALLIFNCFSAKIYSQASFFNTPVSQIGARASALANSYVAESYDVNTMYCNPAALTHLQRFSLVLNHAQEKLVNGMSDGIALPIRIGYGEVIAFGAGVEHIGYLKQTSKTDKKTIQFGYDVAYALEVVPTVSLGASLRLRYAKMGSDKLWGVGSAFGLFYSPAEEVSYGLVLNGVGNGINYIFSGGTSAIRSKDLPKSLQAGVAMRYPAIPNRNTFSLAVANEKIFGTSGINYMGGIEIFPYQYFGLRAGYVVEPHLKAAKYGFGIRTERFELNYSISPSKSTDQSMCVTFSITLWKPKEISRY